MRNKPPYTITEKTAMESVLYENRQQYYQAIDNARRANDSGAFIEFTLFTIAEIITTQLKMYI